ncbi:MAG: hypothetical protein ABW199_03860 [Caulobacterales bacterium]
MTQARKFAFDTEFAADGRIISDNSAALRRYTADEVEAERQAAYKRGAADAQAAAERESAAALKDLSMASTALLQTLALESTAMRNEAAQLAIIAARKIADAALEAFGEERALAAIEQAMDDLRHGPRLIVRTPARIAETIKPRIEAMAAEHNYEGAIVVRADPALKSGAVSIDWSDGVLKIDPVEIAARVEGLVSAMIASADEGVAA